jgi:pilus assembly protein Flp/PilA
MVGRRRLPPSIRWAKPNHGDCHIQLNEGGSMQRIHTIMKRFVRDDEGIAVTEYGLLVALVAVLLIGVVTVFGSSIKSWFADRTSQITTG